jgi:predicted ATPase/DNA-binding CsgD family transcriptional regulator
MRSGVTALLPPLPLVGRDVELGIARQLLDEVPRTGARILFFIGESGIGKTRLAAAVRDEATRRGWGTTAGCAYPVAQGVPYALFAEALVPTLQQLAPETLTALTRGVGELAYLFPGVLEATDARPPEHGDFRNRLAWHFTEFLRGLARRQPRLIVLEDLQWADASTLELLHFVARQTRDVPLIFVGTYNSELAADNAVLNDVVQSLLALGSAEICPLAPLSLGDTQALLRHGFDIDPDVARDFVTLLYGWTRGNPFFIEETLKLLVASGHLRNEHGRWYGWDVHSLELPTSVRDVVRRRLVSLTADARLVAELGAVLGVRFPFEVLRAVAGSDESRLVDAIDELRRLRLLEEQSDARSIAYSFTHPIQRETIYAELGRTRVALLHGQVAESLEAHYGTAALQHSDELAYHFARAHSLGAASKAVQYLVAAGKQALAKHANREAADYFTAALDRPDHDGDEALRDAAAEQLARARQRLGDYDDALALWAAVRERAEAKGDERRVAAIARRMALACYWTGRHEQALAHITAGLAAARAADAGRLQVELQVALAMCLHEVGRPAEALASLDEALALAAEPHDDVLLARVHRALLLTYLWMGDSARTRVHAASALEHAVRSGDQAVELSAHWASALLAGFSGDTETLEHHLRESERLADALRSPVMRLWSAEIEIEYAAARGDWQRAVRLGDHSIEIARALQLRTLLPRLLVWTGLLHLQRDDVERGRAYIEEAWELAGASRDRDHPTIVHTLLPAYAGRAGLCLATGDYAGAIATAREAIAIADRSGCVLWAVHRLLPILAEACLWMRDLDGARQAGARLRSDAARLGHRLGLAWADACDALVAWLAGDVERGAVLLRNAVNELEAVPFVADAARLRRQFAGRLTELGDREGALRELRIVHDVLVRLGATRELAKARAQFRENGARPPALHGTASTGQLTPREREVVRMIVRRRSSKATGSELKISKRTVDAHLANIYRKLGISSRPELVELYRSGELDVST